MSVAISPSQTTGRPAYCEEFGLLENPFRTTPSARYTFLTNSTKEAIAHGQHGIEGRRGLVVISGEIGTGKTTLSRIFADETASEGHLLAFLPRVPGASRQTESKIFSAIASDLDLPNASGRSAEKALTSITNAAIDARDRGKTLVVLIDEAHKLKGPGISALLALLNLQTESDQLVQVLLFGQLPEMADVIRSDGALHSRLAVHTRLNPLLLDDVKKMISHRLHQAGREEQLFTTAAIRALYERSAGIPRKICMIADGACLRAWDVDEKQVDKAHVVASADALMHNPVADVDDDE